MENFIVTQMSAEEMRMLIRTELEKIFAQAERNKSEQDDEIGGIALAVRITGKAKSTIYSLCHQRLIPHSKRGKRLYFSRRDLIDWLNGGKRKTQNEIRNEANQRGS